MQSLSGKVIVIVGATGGIGSVLTRVFHEHGASVSIAARNEAKLEGIVQELRGERAAYMPTDATKTKDLKSLFEFTISEFGHIDCVVCTVGTWDRLSASDSISDAELLVDKHYQSLLKPSFLTAFVAQSIMKTQGYGLIVNISSHAALRPELLGNLSYGAMKAASKHLIRSLRHELVGTGVRVTDLAPAIVNSGETKKLLNTAEKQAAAVQPEDIAQWIMDHMDDPNIPEGHLFDSTVVLE